MLQIRRGRKSPAKPKLATIKSNLRQSKGKEIRAAESKRTALQCVVVHSTPEQGRDAGQEPQGAWKTFSCVKFLLGVTNSTIHLVWPKLKCSEPSWELLAPKVWVSAAAHPLSWGGGTGHREAPALSTTWGGGCAGELRLGENRLREQPSCSSRGALGKHLKHKPPSSSFSRKNPNQRDFYCKKQLQIHTLSNS